MVSMPATSKSKLTFFFFLFYLTVKSNVTYVTLTKAFKTIFPIIISVSSTGFYKVRGVDVFNETSPYSQIVEYLEL